MNLRIRMLFPIVSLAVLLLASPLWAQDSIQLPATGQTQSYTTGDDGALQKGVAWPSPRFTDNLNGTVTDNLTNRIWLKNGNCAQSTGDWPTAFTYVNELNTSGTMNGNNCNDTSNGGSHQTDWRVPNVLELVSLLDLSQPNIGQWLNTRGFTNVPYNVGGFVERYWSSTTYQTDAGDDREHAWTVQITEGRIRHEDKASTSRYYWAVRGGGQ